LQNLVSRTTGGPGGPGGPVTPFAPSVLYYLDKLNSYAVFGQATAPLSTSTRLTLGARVTDDSHQVSSANVTALGPVSSRGGKSWSSPSWRIALDHDLSPNALAYVSWNRGFKSGVFNPGAPASVAPANPETIDAYETGIKSEFLQGRLRVNVGGFWYNDKDLQTRIVLQGGATTIINAAESRNRGVDLDLQFVPIDNLTLTLAGEYLDAKYLSFPGGFLYSSRAPGTVPPGDAGGNNLVAPIDLTGYTLPHAPEFTQSAGFAYKVPSSVGGFAISGLYSYNSGFFWEQDDHLRQPAYNMVDASLSWTAPGDTWALRVWGRNLTDERVLTTAYSNRTSSYGLYGAPRTFGVTFSYHFGK
jgi:iron complex outermembrane receptor protein